MKNRKGFTLVELIGVLTLLGIIALIAFPGVNWIISRGQNEMYETMKETLKTSTRSWLTDNRDLFSKNGDSITITLLDLKQDGLIDVDMKNPKTGECLSNNNGILITYLRDSDNNRFEIKLPNKILDGTDSDCNPVEYAPKIYLVGPSTVDLPIGYNLNLLYENVSGSDTDGYDVIAKSPDGDSITSRVTATVDFDSTKPLKNKTVTYTVSNGGIEKTIKRTVNIVDKIAPVISGVKDITVTKSATSINLLSGVTATDNYDGNITNKITVKSNYKIGVVGTYYATYTVKDSSGNVASQQATITITN